MLSNNKNSQKQGKVKKTSLNFRQNNNKKIFKKFIKPDNTYKDKKIPWFEKNTDHQKNNTGKKSNKNPFLFFIFSIITFPFSLIFFVAKLFWSVLCFPFIISSPIIFKLAKNVQSLFGSGRVIAIRLVFALVFGAVLFRIADLQVFGSSSPTNPNSQALDLSLINKQVLAKRGQIYISDINQNRNNIPITSTKTTGILWFNPKNLKSQLENGLSLDEVLTILSSSVNVDLNDLKRSVSKEVRDDNPKRYFILFRGLDNNQKSAVDFLLTDKTLNRKFGFRLWLGLEERDTRYYQENELLASTIGFTPNYLLSAQEASKRRGCEEMVLQNQARRTDRLGFMVGEYGIEQKYCSVLGGVNGRQVIGGANEDSISQNRAGNNSEAVVDGADVYLTIDRTLQKQAELILAEAMQKNRGVDGSLPRDGCLLVTEVETGKILAMATSPVFDPNNYQKTFAENPMALRNTCTNDDYEVGSVMKPISVASALDLYLAGVVDKNTGKRLGVSPDFKFTDYDTKGKLYRENNGNVVPLRNAEGLSFQSLGQVGLKECIRDSINTCIADVAGATENRYMMNYFVDRFLIGKPTKVDLPGDLNGNITSFEKDLLCDYCWATKSFGQGFSMSPIQLTRAYLAIANNGLMVEPYLVDKIQCSDGTTESQVSRGSCVPSNLALGSNTPKSVVSRASANLVANYMNAVVDEGFMGTGRSGGKIDGYKIAAKSGTAQVSRPIVDKDGNFIRSCSQSCNTEKGIYDHTYVGFNMGSKKYFVMIKISEPKRGLVRNFSSETVAPYFAKMLSYTLSYMGVPKDR